MTNNLIVDLSMDFSVSIVKLCDGIKGKSAIVNQLLRSGTSSVQISTRQITQAAVPTLLQKCKLL